MKGSITLDTAVKEGLSEEAGCEQRERSGTVRVLREEPWPTESQLTAPEGA